MEEEKYLSIIRRLNRGEQTNEIIRNEELYISDSTLRKKLNKAGYCYNKKLGLWHSKNNKEMEEFIKLLVEHDYMEEIEDLYSKRYYCEEVWDKPCSEVKINIANNLFSEIKEKALNNGLEVDLYIELILLKFLTDYHPRKLLNKYYKLIAYLDPETTPFEEIENKIKRYEIDNSYKKEIDKEIELLDEEYIKEFGEEFGEDIKLLLNREYEYKKRWFDRERCEE